MTRLFLRFYLGVIVILLFALMIQTYVYSVTSADRNLEVIEQALGGGALLVRDEVMRGGEAGYAETMERLQSRFAYPIRVIERSDRPMGPERYERIDQGEAVLFWGMIQAGIPDSPYLVELGPLPQFAEPSTVEISLAVGAVFLVTAIAIAILLRPVVQQFRLVERTALAIASGDLSARIDGGQRNSIPLLHAFNTMADRVEDSLRAQRELLQSVSHELRTPLSRIRFASELIRSAKHESQREERIVAIETATDKLDALVGELLTYARFDAASGSSAMAAFDLSELLEDVAKTHQPMAPNIKISYDIGGSSTKVRTHKMAIERAVGNLVGNGCKFAKSAVQVTGSVLTDELTITVDDDGPGIEPQDRERVFEPFHRLSHEATPGYGLGLALVRRISRRLGGDVVVESSPLGGARLRLQIPLDSD